MYINVYLHVHSVRNNAINHYQINRPTTSILSGITYLHEHSVRNIKNKLLQYISHLHLFCEESHQCYMHITSTVIYNNEHLNSGKNIITNHIPNLYI